MLYSKSSLEGIQNILYTSPVNTVGKECYLLYKEIHLSSSQAMEVQIFNGANYAYMQYIG